ncbi:hypothetical protein [Lysinibacillus sp. SGAir0095]|uniref:hypothetical protein n=1 Tax=Lysinibacillus sp. SGAir0095 TaxID=2070463 RepID=UPI00197C50C3|nr:hypothetical protein [Lysinibacillus sp. SGAir0095]
MGILKKKKLLTVTILLMITFLFVVTGCSKTSKDIEKYLNTGSGIDAPAKQMMPTLDQLPVYEKIEYRYTKKTMLFFQSHSVALIVNYDEQTFENENEKLAENFTFSTMTSATTDEASTPDYQFVINSYTFKIVDENEFPKSFGMIGTSDKEQSIAYLYFYDFDLDSIGEEDNSNPMPEFVNDYFNYDF